MLIRPCQPADAEPLLAVFRKNVPHAFAPHEATEYADFLRTRTDPYFVAERDERVLGACGHYFRENGQTAHICWILADPDTQGTGVGSALLRYNLALIRAQPGVELTICRTSQVAWPFFVKFGFRLQYTEPDFWAPGLDLYFMAMP